MTYRSRKTASQQITGIGFVVGLHIVAIYLVASGLAQQAVHTVMGPIETKVIQEQKPKQAELPPPPPKLQTPPPYVPPPDLNVAAPPPSAAPSHAITSFTTKRTPPPPPKPVVGPRLDPRFARRNRFGEDQYPPIARRLGEQGTTTIAVYVEASGAVGEVKVVKSSGYKRLDEAAVNFYRHRARFLPAKSADGKPMGAWKTMKIKFQLDQF